MNAMLHPSRLIVAACLFVTAWFAPPSAAVQVQDIVRLKGAESSKLVGMGLVFGLNGTGDGGKNIAAMRALATVIERLNGASVVAAELKDAKNVAIVALSATLPRAGVREGDYVDVHVSAVGAKSLEGGRLFLIPLTGPRGSRVYAYAEGPVIVENPEQPNVGVIENGAQLTENVMARYFDRFGRLTLVINEENATWPVANNLANLINGIIAPDGPNLARAIDQKNIVIDVPINQRSDPAAFISQILTAYIDPDFIAVGSRVVINEKTGTIVMSGDVQLSPLIISQRGLTITTVTPAPQTPQVTQNDFIGLDPANRGGAKLADLLAAFNQLKVETSDRIAIIKELDRSGLMHAQLILE